MAGIDEVRKTAKQLAAPGGVMQTVDRLDLMERLMTDVMADFVNGRGVDTRKVRQLAAHAIRVLDEERGTS